MAKERSHIIALKNGTPVGYIQSVSYTKGKFVITKEKMNAKGYASHNYIQSEIDKLTQLGYSYGYTFIYD